MIGERIYRLKDAYSFENRGDPTILLISPENMAEFIEEENIDPLNTMTEYMGMEIIVDESSELELHSYASFQAREYQ